MEFVLEYKNYISASVNSEGTHGKIDGVERCCGQSASLRNEAQRYHTALCASGIYFENKMCVFLGTEMQGQPLSKDLGVELSEHPLEIQIERDKRESDYKCNLG